METIDWSTFSFFAFPPFSLIPRCVQKTIQDKAQGILLIPVWITQTWFPLVLQLLYSQPWIFKPSPHLLHHALFKEPHPLHKSLSFIRNTVAQQDLSPDITNILMASWRKGTQTQYKTYVERWLAFCSERKINHSFPKLGEALQFLMGLYNQGLSYSTINTARSASSLILIIEGPNPFGSHPLCPGSERVYMRHANHNLNTKPFGILL